MTVATASPTQSHEPRIPSASARARERLFFLPSLAMISTKLLEIRKRRGLMVSVFLLTIGLPLIVLGIRLVFHAVDPNTYGPAGSPTVFEALCDAMAQFGFIIAATLGTAAGTTDLTDGMFRHLVITGRSRVALYLARIPAGLAILLPLAAVAFTFVCLVTSYAGTSQAGTVNVGSISVPANLSESGLSHWIQDHPDEAAIALNGNTENPKAAVHEIQGRINAFYLEYRSLVPVDSNPAMNEMAKIGAWLELEIAVGFLVGLGLGALIGQCTVATVLMIVVQIIVTPILANTVIPYFLNGQRLLVGIALDQLRPAGLADTSGGHGPFAGRTLGIPPMPTWAMVAVIVGWIVVSTAVGAWRMATRDA
jgi:hypothetical protein